MRRSLITSWRGGGGGGGVGGGGGGGGERFRIVGCGLILFWITGVHA